MHADYFGFNVLKLFLTQHYFIEATTEYKSVGLAGKKVCQEQFQDQIGLKAHSRVKA